YLSLDVSIVFLDLPTSPTRRSSDRRSDPHTPCGSRRESRAFRPGRMSILGVLDVAADGDERVRRHDRDRRPPVQRILHAPTGGEGHGRELLEPAHVQDQVAFVDLKGAVRAGPFDDQVAGVAEGLGRGGRVGGGAHSGCPFSGGLVLRETATTTRQWWPPGRNISAAPRPCGASTGPTRGPASGRRSGGSRSG